MLKKSYVVTWSRKTTVMAAALIILTAAMPVMAAKAKPKPKAVPAPAAPKITKAVDVYAANPVSLAQAGTKIQVTLAPDEYEGAPIVVKSSKDISGAKVTLAGDLVFGGSKLAKSNINAWLVEDGVFRKDSTIRATGDPVAELSSGNTPFWLEVFAPKGTKPGTYKGYVLVSTSKAIGSIPIEVTVLSLRLLRSSKQYGMLVPFTSAAVPQPSYKTYLAETYNAGFSVGALPEPAATVSDVFTAYKESRLGVHGIYAGFLNGDQSITVDDVSGVSSLRRSSGASELYFLGADRPSCEATLSAAQERLRTMGAAGVRTAARIDTPEAYDYLKDDLKAVIYKYDMPYVTSLLSGQKRSNGKREWMYWDASQDAMKNRIQGGLMLWKTSLDGAYIEPGPVDYNAAVDNSGQQLLQPGDGGVLPSVKWEALREGIDDTRYITTLMTVVREAKDQKVAKTTTDAAEAYLNAFLAKQFDTLTYTDLQKFRTQVAQYIIKLRSTVK